MRIRRATLIALAVLFAIGSFPAGAAFQPDLSRYSTFFEDSFNSWPGHGSEAEALNHIGLFMGSDKGFELERAPSRIEALVTVIRLSGKEQEALASALPTTFSDVPVWAAAYAGYGEEKGIVQGVGGGRLGSGDKITAQQYVTMLLRLLGYSEANGDFTYQRALEFSLQIELATDRAFRHFAAAEDMSRGDMAYFMYRAIMAPPKGDTHPMLIALARSGAVDPVRAYGALISAGESDEEIARAVGNGFSQLWFEQLCSVIDKNKSIGMDYKQVFKDCAYQFLKEAGSPDFAGQMKTTLARMTVYLRDAREDAYLRQNPSVLAYFQYPSTIVVRYNMDSGMAQSAFAHEIRHAVSRGLNNTLLEEGMTDLWNQETGCGLPAYSYFYVNTVKVLTHIVGAQSMNEADMSGGIEGLFYALETACGTELDRDRISDTFYGLNAIQSGENLSAVSDVLLDMLKGYYSACWKDIIADDFTGERFADKLIALGQLLYYPSAMAQYAEQATASPAGCYSAEYEAFAQASLAKYAAQTGENLQALQNYYSRGKGTRMCVKYFGQDAGKLLVKTGTAYAVEYQYDNTYGKQLFGTQAAAEQFKKGVKVTKVTQLEGSAFVVKEYK